MSEKFIEVEQIIASKNPRLLKWIPRFVINYIKKILHQEEINEIIASNKNLLPYEFCGAILDYFQITVEVEGLENIPEKGSSICVANHPFGGLEAIALMHEVYPRRNDMKFIVNDILLNLENLKNFFVGVNKHGANSKESLIYLNELFKKDIPIFVFPAGLVSRRVKGEVTDLEWKKTFITRSRKFQKVIVPIFIDGPPLSNFFYNLSNLRKKLGIKANIEMFYLVNEMFKQKNSIFKIHIGQPISYEILDRSKTDREWTEWVRQKVYELKSISKS